MLTGLKLENHPDKTFIGRVERGFTFLGYTFRPSTLQVASTTTAAMVERITRLYEQGANHLRIGRYLQAWLLWLHAGLNSCHLDFLAAVLKASS